MYSVVNQLTHHQFTVDTRDELYQELELLHARKQPLDTPDEYQVQAITADGEITDERLVIIPFPPGETVDSLLLDFDQKQARKSIFPSIKGLFGRKKPIDQPAVSLDAEEETSQPNMKQSRPDEVEESVSTEAPKSVDVQVQVEDSNASEPLDETIPLEEVFESLTSPQTVQEEPEQEKQTEEMGKPSQPLPSSEPSPVAVKEEAPVLFEGGSLAVDVRASSKNLQQHFLATIDQEVAEMDELIERLVREKENHLRMRQALLTTQLY